MDWRRFGHFHAWLYRRTGGRIGAWAGGDRVMCLLTTRGRKSGLPRTAPLLCMRDGKDLVVVASNGGQDHPPAWWRNLEARPEAQVQLRGDVWDVRAHEAEGEEAERLWPLALAYNDPWRVYRERTRRAIPLVVLRPT